METYQKKQLGCGMYGPALLLQQDVWQTYQSLAEIGYTSIEPFVFVGNQTKESFPSRRGKHCAYSREEIVKMIPKLQELGLCFSSLQFGVFAGNLIDVIQDLLSISSCTGTKHFYNSPMIKTTDCEEIRKLADQYNEMNKVLNPYGITVGVHNHQMEFTLIDTELGRMTIMEYLILQSDDVVKMELDTGWAVYGGCDVLAFIRKYAHRISAIHLKDFVTNFKDVEKNDAFCSIGDGCLPLIEILELCEALTLIPHGIMIDQDNPSVNGDLLEELALGAMRVLQM